MTYNYHFISLATLWVRNLERAWLGSFFLVHVTSPVTAEVQDDFQDGFFAGMSGISVLLGLSIPTWFLILQGQTVWLKLFTVWCSQVVPLVTRHKSSKRKEAESPRQDKVSTWNHTALFLQPFLFVRGFT